MLACETAAGVDRAGEMSRALDRTGLPLVIAAPLFGLMLALEPAALWAVAALRCWSARRR